MTARWVTVSAVTAVLFACTPGTTGGNGEEESAELMAAALTQLITVDHTFGSGPPPFSHYLIEEQTANIADFPPVGEMVVEPIERRPLTDVERTVIEDAIAEFGGVQWISDPDEWRTEDLMPRIERSAILAVGDPVADGPGYLVPVTLWCGGLCATWLTYRLEMIDGRWEVTGIEGPVAIS